MTKIQELEKTGTEAVKRLRIRKLRSGHAFMINSKDLPSNQCYLEDPSGSMTLVTILKSAKNFTVIRTLSQREGNTIRAKYNLSYQ